jgi:hypothetical protein
LVVALLYSSRKAFLCTHISSGAICVIWNIQGDQKVSVHLMITVQKTRKNILNCLNTYHDNVVRIRDNRWR